MSEVKWEPIPVEAAAVRRAGITPWRLVLWARQEQEPDRARNLLRASVALLQDEIDRLPAPVSSVFGGQ